MEEVQRPGSVNFGRVDSIDSSDQEEFEEVSGNTCTKVGAVFDWTRHALWVVTKKIAAGCSSTYTFTAERIEQANTALMGAQATSKAVEPFLKAAFLATKYLTIARWVILGNALGWATGAYEDANNFIRSPWDLKSLYLKLVPLMHGVENIGNVLDGAEIFYSALMAFGVPSVSVLSTVVGYVGFAGVFMQSIAVVSLSWGWVETYRTISKASKILKQDRDEEHNFINTKTRYENALDFLSRSPIRTLNKNAAPSIPYSELKRVFDMPDPKSEKGVAQDAAIKALLYTHGVTLNELMDLDREDFDPKNGTLQLNGKKPRAIDLDEDTQELIQGCLPKKPKKKKAKKEWKEEPLFVNNKGKRLEISKGKLRKEKRAFYKESLLTAVLTSEQKSLIQAIIGKELPKGSEFKEDIPDHQKIVAMEKTLSACKTRFRYKQLSFAILITATSVAGVATAVLVFVPLFATSPSWIFIVSWVALAGVAGAMFVNYGINTYSKRMLTRKLKKIYAELIVDEKKPAKWYTVQKYIPHKLNRWKKTAQGNMASVAA